MLQYVHSAQFARKARTRQALIKKKDSVIQCSEATTTICLCRHLCVLKLCKQEYGTGWLYPRCVHVRSSSIIDSIGFQTFSAWRCDFAPLEFIK